MTELRRGITAREFVKALQQDGFELVRIRGSHRIFRHADGRRVVVEAIQLEAFFPVTDAA